MYLPSSESDIQTEEWAPVSYPKASGCVFTSVRGQCLASRWALGVGCRVWGCGGIGTGQQMALGRESSLILTIVHHERKAVIPGEAGLPDSVS